MSGYTTAETGQRLGDYALVKRIAQGGMADIYLGRRDGLAGFVKHVAIKVLSPDRAADPDARALFLDEARLVGQLEHENIAGVLDVAVQEGVHYLAMEFVHGADLRDLLQQATRRCMALTYETSVAIVAAAANGLDHAHRRCGPDGAPLQLVHRDVSLSNVMCGHDGAVKVVDFGIAASTLSTVASAPGVVRGKAAYMSPEQCLGEPLDHRTDVFALGVVLYELTTGTRCFHGSNDFERMLAVVRGDYVMPHDLIADYPPDLEQVVRTALATDASMRYASAAAFADALVRVAAGRRWMLGASVIARTMHTLYGEVLEPWAVPAPDAPAPEPELVDVPVPGTQEIHDTDVVQMLCDCCLAADVAARADTAPADLPAAASRSMTRVLREKLAAESSCRNTATVSLAPGRRRFPSGSAVDLPAQPVHDDDDLTGRRPRLTRRGYAAALAA